VTPLPEEWQTTTPGKQFPLGLICLFVALVLNAKVSLRGAAQVLTLLPGHLGLSFRVPDWTSGRGWLLCVGYYKLMRAKEQADDWVWLIDHSHQLGAEKCLLVLGIRLRDLPPAGECLRLEHLEPLEVLPVSSSNGEEVSKQLQTLTTKTGVPRAILRDDGSDLGKGVRLFRKRYPQTLDLYDIKHKSACLLKKTLGADARWSEFQSQVGATKCQLQQTELAFLVPPSARPKARYMNVAEFVRWGEQTLQLVQTPSATVLQHSTAERVEAKLGWLREYETALNEWSDLMDTVGWAEEFVRRDGIYTEAGADLELVLPANSPFASVVQMRRELLDHVSEQAAGARPNERLPGSTEVLESCFGKLKQVEKEQSRSGFTGMLLSLGVLVGKTTTQVVEAALKQCPLKCVYNWCRKRLGKTIQAKRQEAYATTRATKTG